MYQIHPNETSVGWWRVGSKEQPYGRLARAFQSSTGRNAMYFKFVDRFITRRPEVVKVKVVYYDEFAGSTWQLRYDNGTGSLATAATETCVGDGRWKTKTVTLTNAVFAGSGPQGADLALVNTDSLDDKFHLVEVQRGHDLAASVPMKRLMFGRDSDNHRDGSPNIEAFSREGHPKDASDPGHVSWLSPESSRVLFTHSLP